MKHAVIVLVLTAATATVSSQTVHIALKDGRATCYDLDAAKLSIIETQTKDWHVRRDDGYILASVPNQADAEAAVAVIKRENYTAVCVIGQGTRTFRYFQSVR